MDSYRLLDDKLDKLATTLKSVPSVDANGMQHELIKKQLLYPFEKGQSIESIHKRLKSVREDYFSFLKQSYPDFKKRNKDTSHSCKKSNDQKKELTMFYLKTMYFC